MHKYISVGNVYKPMTAPDDNLHDLKSFKIAKMYIEHYEAILKLIDTAIRGFQVFTAHAPANECLFTLRAQKLIVEGRVNRCRAIISSKGKK